LPIDRKETGNGTETTQRKGREIIESEQERIAGFTVVKKENLTRETRGKTEKEQRKNNETRRIYSLVFSR
jgi:hypothetical protein